MIERRCSRKKSIAKGPLVEREHEAAGGDQQEEADQHRQRVVLDEAVLHGPERVVDQLLIAALGEAGERLLRRAVFIVNKKGMVTYAAYMPTNKDEPDYEEVLAAAKSALS